MNLRPVVPQRLGLNAHGIHSAIQRVQKREIITDVLKEEFAEALTQDELADSIRRAKTLSSA